MNALLALLLTLAVASPVPGGTDPARDYLSNFAPVTGQKSIRSNDILLRLELDLDGDGQYEVLLSMARDVDAKQLNIWTVYNNTAAGYVRAGKMSFNPGSFYLGPIEELSDYGLVTFKPTSEGEGMLWAYLFDGVGVREMEIAPVTRDVPTVDPETGQARGQAVVDRYMSQLADAAEGVAPTSAAALARQYGLEVAGDQPATSPPGASAPSFSSPGSPDPEQAPSPRADSRAARSFPRTVLIVVFVLAAIGALVWRRFR